MCDPVREPAGVRRRGTSVSTQVQGGVALAGVQGCGSPAGVRGGALAGVQGCGSPAGVRGGALQNERRTLIKTQRTKVKAAG